MTDLERTHPKLAALIDRIVDASDTPHSPTRDRAIATACVEIYALGCEDGAALVMREIQKAQAKTGVQDAP